MSLFLIILMKNIKDHRVYSTMGFVGHEYYDLSKIFEQHKIDKIDFAKIDIEGAEWSMFDNIKVEDMQKVNKWAIEFHTLLYNTNVDNSHKLEILWRFLSILEKFSINNYHIYYEHIHKKWDTIHLFAKKISST
jgi:hypothetical protein